jgi:hypothetical protein
MTTYILCLAHGGSAVRLLAGRIIGLPLAIFAIVTVAAAYWKMRRQAADRYCPASHPTDMAAARWKRGRWVIRLASCLSWLSLLWNIGTCTYILHRETPRSWDSWETDEYLWFFGPSVLLSLLSVAAAVSIARHEHRGLRIPHPGPPKCNKCDYLLTGLTVARCPECGTPFDPVLLGANAKAPDG